MIIKIESEKGVLTLYDDARTPSAMLKSVEAQRRVDFGTIKIVLPLDIVRVYQTIDVVYVIAVNDVYQISPAEVGLASTNEVAALIMQGANQNSSVASEINSIKELLKIQNKLLKKILC